jgi:ferredoxin-NADP reductase
MAAEREGRLEAVRDHGADTRSFFLRPAAPLAFRPGQFISCLVPAGGETLIRPYSIASDPEEPERIELLLNLVPGGPGSGWLFGLAPGALVRFTGPWGTFTVDRAPEAEAVFVADGTGIAPIRPMLRRALATGGSRPVRLLYAARAGAPLVYRAEFERLAHTHPRLAFEPLPPGSLEHEVRRRYVDGDADRTRHFFICGVGALVPALRDMLRGAGYTRRAVQYEKW